MTLEFEPPPGVVLRAARPDDYAFARKLYTESTDPLLQALGTWDAAAVAKRFENAYWNRPSQVICMHGNDIGWLQVSQNGTGIHLHQVHLTEKYRNSGIGSRLIRAVMAVAEGLGQPITLNVIRGNPAVALYHRLGFRVVEEDQELLRMRWDPPPPP